MKRYWCRHCNRGVYSVEELLSIDGSVRNGEPYCPAGHHIDLYGDRRFIDELCGFFGWNKPKTEGDVLVTR